MDTKQCRICGCAKPLDDFYKMAGMRDGHRNECKACNLADKRERYASDPGKYIAMVKRWQQENQERRREYQRDYQSRPDRKRAARDAYYQRTFGMSADEFDSRLAEQGGGCAICGRIPEREGSLHLDHHHGNGVIRGILCLSCNQGIGQFRDDPDLLERAALYLRRAETQAVR